MSDEFNRLMYEITGRYQEDDDDDVAGYPLGDETTYEKRREEADDAARSEVEALEAEREEFGTDIDEGDKD
jgi:hypothetical protein